MSSVAGRIHRDLFGTLIGVVTFLGGIGLLLLTFKLAYDMFHVPPPNALGIKAGQSIDFGVAGNHLTEIAVRIVLLFLMSLVGSWIANRGVNLYCHSLVREQVTELKP